MDIRAVILDRDGVLTDFDYAVATAFFQPLLPLSIEEIFVEWESWGLKVGFPRDIEEEKRFFEGFWHDLSDKLEVNEQIRSQLLQFDYTTCIKPFPEVASALKTARRLGLAIGVLSNFSLATIDASLAAAGLADWVDVAMSSTTIGVAKPAPEAYLAIIRALDVEPAQCIYFDDEIDCVKGGRRIGMASYFVERKRQDHLVSDHTVKDLSVIEAILSS